MRKTLYILLAAFTLTACMPDNWLQDMDDYYAGNDNDNDNDNGNGNNGGNSGGGSSGGTYTGKIYTQKEITEKLIGKWYASEKNDVAHHIERYQIEPSMNMYVTEETIVDYPEKTTTDYLKNYYWMGGKLKENGIIVLKNGEQRAQYVFGYDDFYQYHYTRDGRWVCGSWYGATTYSVNVPELMENDRLIVTDDGYVFKRSNSFNIAKDPYEEYWTEE